MKMLLPFFITIFLLSSCDKTGCTNPDATNYKKRAQEDDGSCVYPELRDDIIGDYLVTRTEIHYINGIDTTYSLDSINISKGTYYNRLIIDSYDYSIDFSTGELNFYSNSSKHQPNSYGTLLLNHLQLKTTFHTIHGGITHQTWLSGNKIN